MTTPIDLVQDAAAALAAALPVPAALTVGDPVAAAQLTGAPSLLLPDKPGAAVLARLASAPGSTVSGEVAVIVGNDLVNALASSPLGALDLAAAVQPALDAAVQVAGGGAAAAGQRLEVDLALDTLLARPGAHLVPLSDPGGSVAAAFVIALTDATPEDSGFAPSGKPGAALPDARTVATTPAPPLHQAGQGSSPGSESAGTSRRGGLDLLRDVAMEVTVELGRTRMTVRELLSLSPGAVVELDRAAGSPADLLVNGTLIARGEVVVVDEDFGIRITEIVAPGADGAGESAGAGSSAA
jgi:flagellar motor switch protein FliN/FliY